MGFGEHGIWRIGKSGYQAHSFGSVVASTNAVNEADVETISVSLALTSSREVQSVRSPTKDAIPDTKSNGVDWQSIDQHLVTSSAPERTSSTYLNRSSPKRSTSLARLSAVFRFALLGPGGSSGGNVSSNVLFRR